MKQTTNQYLLRLNSTAIQISPYIKEIMKKLDDMDKITETERMYYATMMIQEVEKLRKASVMATIADQEDYSDKIRCLKDYIKRLSTSFKTSGIFGEISDNPDINRHPYIKSLESSKLGGRTYEDAAEILCKGLQINRQAFDNFSKTNALAYPKIDKFSVHFNEGTATARADGGSASIARAYRWAERNVPGEPGSIDNFIAGYLQAYKATGQELEHERRKMIIKRFGNQDDADDLLAKKLRNMAKAGEI